MSGPVGTPTTSRKRQVSTLALASVLGALCASLAMLLTVALVVYLALALSS